MLPAGLEGHIRHSGGKLQAGEAELHRTYPAWLLPRYQLAPPRAAHHSFSEALGRDDSAAGVRTPAAVLTMLGDACSSDFYKALVLIARCPPVPGRILSLPQSQHWVPWPVQLKAGPSTLTVLSSFSRLSHEALLMAQMGKKPTFSLLLCSQLPGLWEGVAQSRSSMLDPGLSHVAPPGQEGAGLPVWTECIGKGALL